MRKNIQTEPVIFREQYLETPLLTREEVEGAMNRAVEQTRVNLEYFGDRFPTPATRDQVYGRMDRSEEHTSELQSLSC